MELLSDALVWFRISRTKTLSDWPAKSVPNCSMSANLTSSRTPARISRGLSDCISTSIDLFRDEKLCFARTLQLLDHFSLNKKEDGSHPVLVDTSLHESHHPHLMRRNIRENFEGRHQNITQTFHVRTVEREEGPDRKIQPFNTPNSQSATICHSPAHSR